MTKPEPFEISLPEERLSTLRQRLEQTQWPGTIGADDWTYGVPQVWLQDMQAYWLNEWDWQRVAAEMNQYTHYKVDIDDIPIHYWHVPAAVDDAPAIVLTHGWPWTFWDYRHIVDALANPDANGRSGQQAYDVYVPSLPGFGFSTPLTTPGIGVKQVAELWVKLMTEVLGHKEFCAHGGDWGALITAELAHAHADKLIGAHLALTLIPGVDRNALTDDAFSEDEQWMIERNQTSLPHITSHLAVHRLDPQTLGYALSDSPIGTAAWIWERRHHWSDCGGDIESAFDKEHLCTTAALYWCTGAINSSLRIYHEHFKAPWALAHNRTPVMEAPTGYAIFPKDVVHMPKAVLAAHSDLRRYTVMPKGGHFGAFEAPNDLIPEIDAFFAPLI